MILNALVAAMVLSSCFGKKRVESTDSKGSQAVSPVPQKAVKVAPPKDVPLTLVARYLQQADSIHREAWWVVSTERRPANKSPFGKVLRSVLAEEGLKLGNKSLFSCDHYTTKRNITNVSGYPQNAEVFENCSGKGPGRKIAEWTLSSPRELRVSFYPDSLQELLGVGAAILNRKINCTLKGDDRAVLSEFDCQNWAQSKTDSLMIRLDVYQYKAANQNLLILQGKVYNNLQESRKIEARVPMTGKIKVVETELFAPPEEPAKPAPAVSPVKAKVAGDGQQPGVDENGNVQLGPDGQPLQPAQPGAGQRLRPVAGPRNPVPGVPVPMAMPTDPSQMQANPQMPQDGDDGEQIPQEQQGLTQEQNDAIQRANAAGVNPGVIQGATQGGAAAGFPESQEQQQQGAPAADSVQSGQGEPMDDTSGASPQDEAQPAQQDQQRPLPQSHPPANNSTGGGR